MPHNVYTGGHLARDTAISFSSNNSSYLKTRIYESKIKKIGPVLFPPFAGERVYMLPFYKNKLLPKSLKHWQSTIDAMLNGIITNEKLYLMIDQGKVIGGQTHRRAGPHIDGNWVEDHKISTSMYDESLILASNIEGCLGYVGKYEDKVAADGDCSNCDLSKLEKIRLLANIAYCGNVTFVHESIPIEYNCKRTLVRINVPHHKF